MNQVPRFVFPALAALSLLLSLLFAWMVPEGANPDENAHRDYVKLLATTRQLVVFVPPAGRVPLPAPVAARIKAAAGKTELVAEDLSRDETHQPPLYYVLAALVWSVSGGSLLAVRMLSAPFQIATIYLVLRAVGDLLPRRPEVAVGAAAFVAVLPIQAQLAGAISNDALTHLLCVGLVWGAIRWAARGGTTNEALILGLVFGLGLWTKLTVLQMAPVIALAGIVAVVRKRMPVGRSVTLVGLAVAVGVTIAVPWLLRNLNLYGDPLARTIYEATGPNFHPDQVQQMAGWSQADYLRNVGVRSFASFFYFFHPNLPLKQFAGSPAPLALVLLLSVAVGFGIRRAFVSGENGREDRVVVAVAAAVPLVLLPFFVSFVLTVFQAQGRYFLPSLLGVALVWAYGGASLLPERRWAGIWIGPAVLLVLALFQLLNGGFVVGLPPR